MISNGNQNGSTELLAADGLVKHYGKRRVVKGVSFHVRAGEIVGLLGPNGAGKTTSFLMALGQVRPDSGTIRLNGEDVTRLPTFERARRGMSYLAQEASIFRRMTVEQNVMAVLEVQKLARAERKERAHALLEGMDILNLRNNRAETLSGGERRRLEIARALATDPHLILLDEPFAGVDPIATEEIQRIVTALKDHGIGILLTDHDVRATLSITDRAYIIYEGQILKHGPARTLVTDPVVRKIYLGEQFQFHMPDPGVTAQEVDDLDRDKRKAPAPPPAAGPKKGPAKKGTTKGGTGKSDADTLVDKSREIYKGEKRRRKRK